jgi:hypothetical protein
MGHPSYRLCPGTKREVWKGRKWLAKVKGARASAKKSALSPCLACNQERQLGSVFWKLSFSFPLRNVRKLEDRGKEMIVHPGDEPGDPRGQKERRPALWGGSWSLLWATSPIVGGGKSRPLNGETGRWGGGLVFDSDHQNFIQDAGLQSDTSSPELSAVVFYSS